MYNIFMARQVVRVIIENEDGKVLLAKSARSGSIKFLGGGMVEGETANQTALRKLFEEAKLKIDETDLQYLGELTEIISEDNPDIIPDLKKGDIQQVHYYLVNNSKKAVPGEAIMDLEWIDKDAVLDSLTYQTQKEAFSRFILGKEIISPQQWTKEVN